ncbi:hypothetical protein [Streptomyces sp. NPDC057623]|uniref:hypothetical protein n=1 Tax=Streptomyces sp. NPDC057623 TaxID=3346187 RepID=UPI0036941ADF
MLTLRLVDGGVELVAQDVILPLTSADLVRLYVESGDALAQIRAIVEADAELWERERRRRAAQAPEVGLLQRVLEGLRQDRFAPA